MVGQYSVRHPPRADLADSERVTVRVVADIDLERADLADSREQGRHRCASVRGGRALTSVFIGRLTRYRATNDRRVGGAYGKEINRVVTADS